ncbi:alpha-D-glucose phosphate-specific phosphoglucomutase [Onishia niordana]|uniref:alpha-D-glucose phosphate-specific phosphoglucomutase n=1 Tax=Onishia niordana TaxID=2508711 RepID=UPI0010A04E10|nr:alpha-D-glucose phosphate-specific phosphoglucomutase [Halomonas niordiana]
MDQNDAIAALLKAFTTLSPDADRPEQAVTFGTSGHRGKATDGSFNREHILAITQAVVDVRREEGITGPLLLGRDSHALSLPAWQCALQVLIANGVTVHIERDHELTATPLISRAILAHNATPGATKADGLIITPSHNPPEDGGIKYNPLHGGPADGGLTRRIEQAANAYLRAGLDGVREIPLSEALGAATPADFLGAYVAQLGQAVDLSAIADAGLVMAADPMGGTALPVWQAIADQYRLPITVVNTELDPSFGFMPPDHDGKTRMDCSSPAAMANLLAQREGYDLAFGNDPDADRHGIVDADGLMNPNHFLAVAVDYLIKHRPNWPDHLMIGKTLVSSSMIDRVVSAQERKLYEVPVGFKWFVDGLHEGWLAFGGEESAGASFLTLDGRPWSTDKDGILLCLLAAEILAVTGKSPSAYYRDLVEQYGEPFYRRVDTPCTSAQQSAFKALSDAPPTMDTLAGDPVTRVLTHAPGNQAPIGGVKVETAHGWFAARPSGTEPLYKVYAESFRGAKHLDALIQDAQQWLERVLVP